MCVLVAPIKVLITLLAKAMNLSPKGPSTQIVRLQGPKTIQSMDFGT